VKSASAAGTPAAERIAALTKSAVNTTLSSSSSSNRQGCHQGHLQAKQYGLTD